MKRFLSEIRHRLRMFLIKFLFNKEYRFIIIESLNLKEDELRRKKINEKYYDGINCDDDLHLIWEVRWQMGHEEYYKEL